MYSLLRNEGLRKELAGQAKTLLTTVLGLWRRSSAASSKSDST